MHYGAAHIVWDDENFARHHVQWCLDHFDEYKREDCTDTENVAVRDSLIALLALPDHVLDPFPDDDDALDVWDNPNGLEFEHVQRV